MRAHPGRAESDVDRNDRWPTRAKTGHAADSRCAQIFFDSEIQVHQPGDTDFDMDRSKCAEVRTEARWRTNLSWKLLAGCGLDARDHRGHAAAAPVDGKKIQTKRALSRFRSGQLHVAVANAACRLDDCCGKHGVLVRYHSTARSAHSGVARRPNGIVGGNWRAECCGRQN